MEFTAKNIIYGISLGGTIFTLFTSGGNIGDSFNSVNQARESNLARYADNSTLQQSEEDRKAAQKIANDRYDNCELFVHGSWESKVTLPSLSSDLVITDRTTGKPFPKGTVVCDANGNTGIIGEAGKPRYMAFTGDRDQIKKRVQRFRGGIYSQPVAK